jgi:hypothetical protein
MPSGRACYLRLHPDLGRVVVGPVPAPGCVLGPCGRSFWHACRALSRRDDFAVSPRGSIKTTLPPTTFGSVRLGTPCLRTQAANLRSGRRTNETGLASNVIHAPFGPEEVPLPVEEVVVGSKGCNGAAASAVAASRPAPTSTASVAARTPQSSEGRREPNGGLRARTLRCISVPRFEVAGLFAKTQCVGGGCVTVTSSGIADLATNDPSVRSTRPFPCNHDATRMRHHLGTNSRGSSVATAGRSWLAPAPDERRYEDKKGGARCGYWS